ncbi:hypothetical protein BD769DRAFT_71591 [Suillus cothurnatus]|jgi:F420-0:gamma-glutamyl ligase-like protein|nr:hypothetical protein BD769DRAFT_71591 [Suillus cothurnatus]
MKLTSTLLLSFIASAQAATTISSVVLPSGIPAYVTFSMPISPNRNKNTHITHLYRSSGLPFSTVSLDTTAATSLLSSLYSSESSAVQSVLSSLGTVPPTVTSTSSAQAATTSSAAGRTEAGLGLGLAAGAAAGLLGFLF